MTGLISAVVSKRKLKFTPMISDNSLNNGSDENEFDVTVTNESNKLVSFQLELEVCREKSSTLYSPKNSNSKVLTAQNHSNGNNSYRNNSNGSKSSAEEVSRNLKWYSVQPEVCAKIPPGCEAKFHVAIIDSPVPVYDTTIELLLKVFSVENSAFDNQKLTLQIDKPKHSFSIHLPQKYFQVRPGEVREIPVVLKNFSNEYNKINLEFIGSEIFWIENKNQGLVLIKSGDSQETTFLCKPPLSPITPSGKYEFKISAESLVSGYQNSESGSITILPQGFVQLDCQKTHKIIPGKNRRKRDEAFYKLSFENRSNVLQEINVTIPEKYRTLFKGYRFNYPQPIQLEQNDIKEDIILFVTKERPLFGRKKQLNFHFEANFKGILQEDSQNVQNVHNQNTLSQNDNNFVILQEPVSKILTLDILPKIPFWLQLGLGFLIPFLLLLGWWLRPTVQHTGEVNSVRLVGNNRLILSGSKDQTIKLWQVDTQYWQLDSRRLRYQSSISEGIDKAIRVIRQSPIDDDLVAAGLDNGNIKLWNLSSKTDKGTLPNLKNDRVFDVVFTKDGRYLFSGHGSGTIRRWDMNNITNPIPTSVKELTFNPAIYALALNEETSQPNSLQKSSLLFTAGQYNKLTLWNLKSDKLYNIQDIQDTKKAFRDDYINSLATAGNILASADVQGNLKLWDINLDKCDKITNLSAKKDNKVENTKVSSQSKSKQNQQKNTAKNTQQQKPQNQVVGKCKFDKIKQWVGSDGKQPIRSVALTQDASYLASAGDDGKVKLWSVEKVKDATQKGDKLESYTGEQIDYLPGVKLNSIDVKILKDDSGKYLLITVGDDHNYVRLYRRGVN